jgi:hypothetical protein
MEPYPAQTLQCGKRPIGRWRRSYLRYQRTRRCRADGSETGGTSPNLGPIFQALIGLVGTSAPGAAMTCHARRPYGRVTPQPLRQSPQLRSTPWHLYVTSAQKNTSQAITSATQIIRRNGPLIPTFNGSAPWSTDRQSASGSAPVALEAARSRRLSNSLPTAPTTRSVQIDQ